MTRELRELLERARQLPPMTADDHFLQRVSYVYGEMNLDGRCMSYERVYEIAIAHELRKLGETLASMPIDLA